VTKGFFREISTKGLFQGPFYSSFSNKLRHLNQLFVTRSSFDLSAQKVAEKSDLFRNLKKVFLLIFWLKKILLSLANRFLIPGNRRLALLLWPFSQGRRSHYVVGQFPVFWRNVATLEMHLFEAVFEAPLLTITEDHSTSAPASVPI
jgi:hypothetical protein